MDPILTCRFRLDEATVRRAQAERFRKYRVLNLVFAAFCLGMAALLLIRYLRKEEPGFYEFVPVVIFVAAAGILVNQNLRLFRRGLSQFMTMLDQEIGSRESDLIVRFWPDRFVTENSCKPGPSDNSYEDVVEIFRGKTTAALVTKDGRAFNLDPSRFENGTEADFWKLMNEKCPDAVPKNYRQV